MKRYLAWMTAVLLAFLLLFGGMALADGVVSTSVVMRVSRLTQDAVVSEGEDLSMEINIDGLEPASYQWYFNDAPIADATQRVYNIVGAREEDAGVYRLDAFDADGGMALRMDIAVRVVTKTVPQAGDHSLPLGVVIAAMGAAALLLTVKARRAAA